MKLYPSQQEFVSELLALLQVASGKLIVLVTGLSGVGKTTVLKSVGRELAELGGVSVVDGEKFAAFKCKRDRNYIVPAAPHAARQIREKFQERFPGYELKELILRGLTRDETRDYLASEGYIGEILELAAEISMGIPLAATQIASTNITDRGIAIGIVRWYASRTLYLEGMKSPKVIPALSEYVRYTVLESDVPCLQLDPDFSCASILARAAMRRAENASRCKVEFADPVFKTPESEVMYDRLLKLKKSEMKADCVGLFIPSVTPEMVRLMMDETGTNYWCDRFNQRMHNMFVEIRKGDATLLENREAFDLPYPGDDTYGECLKWFPVKDILDDSDYPVLGIYTRDHAECSAAVLSGAIGLETHLQQLSISYYVAYGFTGQVFRFDPPNTLTQII